MRTAWMLVTAVACTSWVETSEDGLRHLAGVETSGRRGFTSFVEVSEGETSLLFTGQPAEDKGVFLRVVDPEGEVLLDITEVDTRRTRSGGLLPMSVTSLGWPIAASDAPLVPGRWRFDLGVVDDDVYVPGVDTQLDVLLKQDDDFSAGSLEVHLLYAGTTRTDGELHRAMEGARAVWSSLYAAIGLELEVVEGELDLETLPWPGRGGGEDYLAVSGSIPLRAVPVVLVPEIQAGIYGVSGGLPGSLVPSERGAVVISSLVNSGPDLLFDAEEERLLGETIAHEVLHYLGLLHPVEPTWDRWDALEDTQECGALIACINQLGDNLMFPFPPCDAEGCLPQTELTPDQQGVAHRYAGVR